MSLVETIETNFKLALKSQDRDVLNVLRMLKTALKNKEIELKKNVDEVEALKVVKSEVKKRKESIESYVQSNRQDLADQEKKELEILKEYMPAEMSDEELRKKIQVIIDKIPEEGRNNFGQVMGMVMKELDGKVDGGRVSVVLREML